MSDTYPFDSKSDHDPTKQRIAAIFNHWVETCRPNGRQPVLDAKRTRIIEKAIISHGANMCFLAIQGNKLSDFHQGANSRGKKYDELSLILRDAEHIEQFVTIADEHQGGVDAWIAAN